MKKNVLIIGFIALIILGVSMISYANDSSNSGRTTSMESYGGDAYTGIQQASATTANNVYKNNDNLLFYIKSNGIFYVIAGATGLLYCFFDKSKNQSSEKA